jgi:hypothetical protein
MSISDRLPLRLSVGSTNFVRGGWRTNSDFVYRCKKDKTGQGFSLVSIGEEIIEESRKTVIV